MIEYIVKSTICLLVFYLCYLILLSNTRQFQFNRFYLLFALLFSMVFPCLHFTLGNTGILEAPNKVIVFQTVTALKTVTGQPITGQVEIKPDIFNISTVLFFIYAMISILLLVRFTRNFHRLVISNPKYEKGFYRNNKLILIHEKSNPYSFLNFIYVNKYDYQSGSIDKELLYHEIAHKSQLHSIDIILIEIIQIFYWFNPLVYLIKRVIKINHEYIADQYVLQSGIHYKDYSHKLINYTFRNKGLNLASGFDYLLTKKRLIMISKNKIKRKWLVTSIILTCLITIMLSSLAFTNQPSAKQKGVTFINKKSLHEMALNDSIFIASDFDATINNVFIKAPLIQFNKYSGTFLAGPFKGQINIDLLILTVTEKGLKVESSSDNMESEKGTMKWIGNAKVSVDGFEFKAKEIQINQ